MRFVVCNFWSAPRVTQRRRFRSARSIKSGASSAGAAVCISGQGGYRRDVIDAPRPPANDSTSSRKTA